MTLHICMKHSKESSELCLGPKRSGKTTTLAKKAMWTNKAMSNWLKNTSFLMYFSSVSRHRLTLGWVRTLSSKAWSSGSLAGNSENATYQSHVSVYVPITWIFKLHGDLGIRDLSLLSAIQVNWFSNEDLHNAYLAVQQKWKSDDFV